MNAGLYCHYAKYEMLLSCNFSGVAVGSFGTETGGYFELSSTTFDEPTAVQAPGVKMSIAQARPNSARLVGDFYTYSFTLGGTVMPDVTGSTFAASRSMKALFTDLKLYWFGGYWRISYASCEVFIDGASHVTYGAGTIDSLTWQAKCAVPLFGVQPRLSGSTGAIENPAHAIPPAGTTPNLSAAASASAVGGWRFQRPGSATWIELPVTTNVLDPLATTCPVGTPAFVKPTATTTYDGAVSAHADFTYTWDGVSANGQIDSNTYASQIYLFDDCPASVGRIGDDHHELWYRGGMPRTEHSQFWTCAIGNGDAFTSDIVFTEQHPMQSEILSMVGNPAHAIEDTFGHGFLAAYSVSAGKFTSPFGAETQGTSTTGSHFPARLTFDGSNIGYYRHRGTTLNSPELVASYVNYWGARHMQYFYWFPDDTGVGVQWPIAGVTPTVLEFFLLYAKQHLTHPSLPMLENRQTQNNVPSLPGFPGISATGAFVKARLFANTFTSFVGLSRFKVQTPTVPVSLTLDAASSGAWSFQDCTAAFAAGGITLTAVGSPASFAATYDLGAFGSSPYQYVHLCDVLKTDWNTANVNLLSVYLVDSLGKEKLLTTGPPPVTSVLTSTQDDYYAGSWAQQYGGTVLSNVGLDQLPTGQSASQMSDTSFAQAFQMFTGRSPHKLKFVIVPTDPAVTVLLKYPTFTYCATAPGPLFVPESSGQVAILYPDGPAARIGQHTWHYDGDVQLAPLLHGAATRTSVVDWLVVRRVLFEGISGTSGLNAELATIYDAVEGQAREDAAQDTLAFWLPSPAVGSVPYFAISNLYSEMPPMSGWPNVVRAATTFVEKTTPVAADFVLKTWSYSVESRHYPGKTADAAPVQLFTSAGVQKTATEPARSGWTSSAHAMVVDGNEALDYEVRHAGIVYAKVRPWDGYFSLVYLGTGGTAKGVSYDVSRAFKHERAYADGASAIYGKGANYPLPIVFADSTIATGVTWTSVRFLRTSGTETVWMATGTASAVVLRKSTNGGTTFTVAAVIGAGTKPSLCALESGGFIVYWIDGGSLKGQIRSHTGAISTGTFTVTAADDQGIGTYEYPTQSGRAIAVLYAVGGDLYRRTSSDGVTFGAATLVEVSARKAAGCVSRDGKILECWITGTAIRGRRIDLTGTVVDAPTTWVAANVDDDQIAVGWSTGNTSHERAVLLYPSLGVITQKVSADGGTTWA